MVFLRLKIIWINVVGFIKIPMKYVILGSMVGLQSFLSREESLIMDQNLQPSLLLEKMPKQHICASGYP